MKTGAANHRLLTAREERTLARRAHSGDRRARDQLVKHNIRLVYSIAGEYTRQGLDFDDLVQEGCIGLMRAVEKYDPERGYRFSTMASWWIKQAVQRAVADQSRTIRLPVHQGEKVRKVKRAASDLETELEREPTAEEIADRLAWDVSRVEDALEVSKPTASLHRPATSDEGSAELGTLIADASEPGVPSEALDNIEASAISEGLEGLPSRERYVISRRYALDGEDVASLRRVAEELGVSRDNVHQLQRRAEQKLRSYADLQPA